MTKHKHPKETSKSNLKLISTSSGVRISQACDRCRIKKIKCDGQYPCSNCKKVDFECKTSDKLTRRAFPKGYTENLEFKLKELERENQELKEQLEHSGDASHNTSTSAHAHETGTDAKNGGAGATTDTTSGTTAVKFQTNQSVQINNPIEQIFNIDNKGIIIGNDNLNFESQFNHLLIDLNLPFLKITNTHNYLLNDPNAYLYNPSYQKMNQLSNVDMDLIYNPLTAQKKSPEPNQEGPQEKLPTDSYELFIKLVNNLKRLFASKRELDNQIVQFFLNYNILVPIFDYKQFMQSYNAFHTMYPFIFTYDDSTINGFNLSNVNDYEIVNAYFMIIVQIYVIIMITDPTINLNLLLNHNNPKYMLPINAKDKSPSILTSIYDLLPYFNQFHISVNHLQTYLLFLHYSLLTNNKEKSLVLSSLINAFIGVLGINLNSKNLFFNDLSLSKQQRRNRVKIFWVFKILLKCFNLKFGFKPSLNTTVINPVTIDRYFQLTPEKLSLLLDGNDDLFDNLLKPSIEFLNLMNIVIPSSFSPNYYQYLRKQNKKKKDHPSSSHRLDWILNEDDGDGNDGNLNYNFNQFLIIDKNLSNWRMSLKDKKINLLPLQSEMGLPDLLNITENNLYHDMRPASSNSSTPQNDKRDEIGITEIGILNFLNTGVLDIHTSSQLIKIQLNFHYAVIRSMNYLNFIIDKELNFNLYQEIEAISSEVLNYFIMIFIHITKSEEQRNPTMHHGMSGLGSRHGLGLHHDMDHDGIIINDFSMKRRKINRPKTVGEPTVRIIPVSPFNFILNGLSMTIINLKKSIILQMLYLLLCQLRYAKESMEVNRDSILLLWRSVDLFINVFINYKLGVIQNGDKKENQWKSKQDRLFEKLINDELKEEILKSHEYDDEDDDDDDEIDWDDEEMDEDLKYLKILKFIKYKSMKVLDQSTPQSSAIPSVLPHSLPTPTQVHHHHHHHHNDQNKVLPSITRPPSSTRLPQLPFYSNSNSFTSLSKIPSITKFDFMDHHHQNLTENHLISKSASNEELEKKERGIINDLIGLRSSTQGTPSQQQHLGSLPMMLPWPTHTTGGSRGNSTPEKPWGTNGQGNHHHQIGDHSL
ncbi:uncharacterized protein J8A68_003250 [[Candida] subhashii]|uniref:Zn(2)-C6 fungal-type domain-containing protein n=1 Tax=[Candida] subhashii TaxID=561895 RepID=A0A8J5QW04_9ASCO|nr:uncharacterized protein J8A68_003250 [[Candida] subhashii]KAG7663250.1 hypothetical protein J8A68_003250 [[Candida] subhashii]